MAWSSPTNFSDFGSNVFSACTAQPSFEVLARCSLTGLSFPFSGQSWGEVFVNPTGNPGMATAGTGDVLAGMIAALVAQDNDPLPGILAAVFLHGMAGDLAAAERGAQGLMASDLLDRVPEAMEALLRAEE